MSKKQKESILRHLQRIYCINSLTTNSICGLELTCDLAALDDEHVNISPNQLIAKL